MAGSLEAKDQYHTANSVGFSSLPTLLRPTAVPEVFQKNPHTLFKKWRNRKHGVKTKPEKENHALIH